MENREILKNVRNKTRHVIPYTGIIFIAVAARLLPHLPNMTPITGLALFSGSSSKNKCWLLVPIIAMLVSDIFLGFHTTIPFVYGSFFIITIFGKFITKKSGVLTLSAMSFFSSLIFYVITNFGVWATSSMYTKNIQGLISSYLMGIPFFWNTILGDFIYTMTFFYGYRLLVYLLQVKKAKVQV